jgi:hypothetical protein
LKGDEAVNDNKDKRKPFPRLEFALLVLLIVALIATALLMDGRF